MSSGLEVEATVCATLPPPMKKASLKKLQSSPIRARPVTEEILSDSLKTVLQIERNVVVGGGEMPIDDGDHSRVDPHVKINREIVLGKNMHESSLEIREPEMDDEVTGEMDAHMAAVLARYRKTLVERTKFHLGECVFKRRSVP
jgi:uncharacterized protein (DUF342 family)